VDTRKLDHARLITAAGGVILIVSLFLHWVEQVSAWDGFSNVHILMLLIGIAAIAFGLIPAPGLGVTPPPGASRIVTTLGLVVFGFAAGWELEVSGGAGVWLAIVGSLTITLGAHEAGHRAGRPASERRASR
jgi:hypothetical protein